MSMTLIRNAAILTMDQHRRVIPDGYVVIEGPSIMAVGDGEPDPGLRFDETIDAQGKVLMPGFVQIHVHLCQALFRGLSDDMELMDWLRTRTWPLEACHDEESVYASARLGIAEMLRGGTTTILDMQSVNHAEAAFHGIRDTGIRAVSGKVMMDWGDDVPEPLREVTEESLARSIELFEEWDGAAGGRIGYAFTPRFAVSCSDRLLREVGEIARQKGARVHTHSSENLGEIEIVMRERGKRNILYLEDAGLLGPTTVLAHCIHLDKAEFDALARTGTNVAHCPSANLKLASGIANIPEMLDAGINVGLGADGAGDNNNLDQLMEMRMAALVHKPRLGPRAMPAMRVLELATINGARALGWDHIIGSLEAGKRADIIMLDLAMPHSSPASVADPVSRVVYSAQSQNVVMTMVDGKVLFDNGRLTTMDEAEVLCEADEAIGRLARRAGVLA